MPVTIPLSRSLPFHRGRFRPGVPARTIPDWFHISGKITPRVFRAFLPFIWPQLPRFPNLLRFRCRFRPFPPLLPAVVAQAPFRRTDSDEMAIEWIREHYPDVETAVITNEGLPPLAFEDGRFDLVLGYSVFTHLNVSYQDAWLGELRRLVRPFGILLLPSAVRACSITR